MSASNLLSSSLFNKRHEEVAGVSVAFVLCQGFVFQYFSGFLDVLNKYKNKCNEAGFEDFTWSVIGGSNKPIRSSCNIEVLPRCGFDEPAKYDYIVIVGGSTPSSQVVEDDALDFIVLAHKHNVPLVGIASGRHVLASLSLLDGRKCAVDALCEPKFRSFYPKIETISYQSYIIDSQLITCPGSSSVVKLASTLMSRHFGRYFSEEYTGEATTSDNQSRPAMTRKRGDVSVRKAIEYMERNISVPIPIKTLADHLGMTPCQLDGAFSAQIGMTPSSVWRKLRLDRAFWLLTNTERKITDIALECGYYDSAHFNKAFKSTFSAPPKEVRSKNYFLSTSNNEYQSAHVSS